jgi:hypothetical protein
MIGIAGGNGNLLGSLAGWLAAFTAVAYSGRQVCGSPARRRTAAPSHRWTGGPGDTGDCFSRVPPCVWRLCSPPLFKTLEK